MEETNITPQNLDTPKSKKPWLKITVISLIVVLILVAVVYFVFYKKISVQKEQLQTQTPISSIEELNKSAVNFDQVKATLLANGESKLKFPIIKESLDSDLSILPESLKPLASGDEIKVAKILFNDGRNGYRIQSVNKNTQISTLFMQKIEAFRTSGWKVLYASYSIGFGVADFQNENYQVQINFLETNTDVSLDTLIINSK